MFQDYFAGAITDWTCPFWKASQTGDIPRKRSTILVKEEMT